MAGDLDMSGRMRAARPAFVIVVSDDADAVGHKAFDKIFVKYSWSHKVLAYGVLAFLAHQNIFLVKIKYEGLEEVDANILEYSIPSKYFDVVDKYTTTLSKHALSNIFGATGGDGVGTEGWCHIMAACLRPSIASAQLAVARCAYASARSALGRWGMFANHGNGKEKW
ncbi:hypothetical protein B0H14DRAFT_3440291 [Mycena olivaceomarginata]|nr:hypothetical protein B0H14DRAFT_3474478 [Mycena olivaceomarginata]KAJ7870071.1 hypothetical protein B0H14DRAFT_3440291 [Mycena olivaceomarginata]